jgi:hypothetical protein
VDSLPEAELKRYFVVIDDFWDGVTLYISRDVARNMRGEFILK